jgi:Domain of unknown function (DUF4185)
VTAIVFQPLRIHGQPPLGNFEVPTGAFSYDGRLYVFIARDRTGTGLNARMNTSHLAVTTPESGNDPQQPLAGLGMVASTLHAGAPAGSWLVHICPTVVRNADWPGLPRSYSDGLILFGTSLYHTSNLYLAWAPLESPPGHIVPWGVPSSLGMPVPPPSQWRYYAPGPHSGPTASPEDWHPAAELPEEGPRPLLDYDWLGEVSVTWHPALKRWLAVYLGPDSQIHLRYARYPWGPWVRNEPRIVVFDGRPPDQDPDVTRTADNLMDGHQFVGLPAAEGGGATVPYAPYLIPHWTRFDRSLRQLTLYYTLSTQDPPYNSQLMRSQLRWS